MQISTIYLSKPIYNQDEQKHVLKWMSERIADRRSQGAGNVSASSSSPKSYTTSTCSGSSARSTELSPSSRLHHGDPIRHVTCETKVRCRFVPSHKLYANDEYDMSWYSVDEQKDIARRCIQEVQKLQKGKLLHDVKYSARGLEGHTMTGAMAKAKNRNLAYDVVLGEQDRQRRLGTQDVNAIADAYHAVAHSSELWARTVALRDQRDAMLFMENLQNSKRDILSDIVSKQDPLIEVFDGDNHRELRETPGRSSKPVEVSPQKLEVGTAIYSSQQRRSSLPPKAE